MPPEDNTPQGPAPKKFDAIGQGRKVTEEMVNGPPPPDNRSAWEKQHDLIADMNRREQAEKARKADAGRHVVNTVNESTYVPARILWPALGFPAVIAPGSNDPAFAARSICILLLSNRGPEFRLSKKEVADHLRIVPWAKRRERRHIPAGGAESFREEDIEVRGTDSFMDDGRAQLVNLAPQSSEADSNAKNGFVIGLSSWVRKFYATRLPEKERLPHLYEVRIHESAVARLAPGAGQSPTLYNLFWNNKGKKDDKQVRSDEMHTLIEHFALNSRFGNDGVLPLKSFVGTTREAQERKYMGEYEYEHGRPKIADHRTEVLHPVFIGAPMPQLRIGHMTDLHMDTRIDALDRNMKKAGATMHNWNQACKKLYEESKQNCDVLLMTGDLIDFGRGYNDLGPMKDEKSYWRDRNWFNFYEFLASGTNYAKPVYTTLGNHDWRINPYPMANDSAPKAAEVGSTKDAIKKAHGPGATGKSYSTDPAMFVTGLVKLVFSNRDDGRFEVSRTALVTETASVAWYLLLINPFLDYACRLPGGYNLLMLDWAEDEVVDPEVILAGESVGRGLIPDNYGGPLAKNCLTKVQKELVERVANGPIGARILGIHQPPIGPHEHWVDDELSGGFVRYTENDMRAVWDARNKLASTRAFDGTDAERTDSLHRMRGQPIDGKVLHDIVFDGLTHAGGVYPTLALRTGDDPLGREATCGTLVTERDWLIWKLGNGKFNLVLAGHIHRRHVLIIDITGKKRPAAWLGKWIVRSVPSGKPPTGYGPIYVNSTSAGPLGHVYKSRGKYLSAESAYTYVSIAASGLINTIEFRPDKDLTPSDQKGPSPWVDEGATIGAK